MNTWVKNCAHCRRGQHDSCTVVNCECAKNGHGTKKLPYMGKHRKPKENK